MTEFDTTWTDKDAYVDESSPDLNFGTGTTIHVRSWEGVDGTGANQRAYIGFDLNQLSLPSDIEDRIIEALVRFPVNEESTDERTLELFEIAPGDWAEDGITWNSQPAAGASQDTDSSDAASTGLHAFDVTDLFLTAHSEGRDRLEFMSRDTVEGATLEQQQDYDSREGGTSTLGEDEAELQVLWKSAGNADVSSTVEPQLFEDIDSAVLPRFSRVADLSASIEPLFSQDMTGIVEVQPVEIDDGHQARAIGRVSITLEGVLEDVQAVFDEVATTVEVGGDDADAVVQLVDEDSVDVPTQRASDPAELSRGDARLFVLGDGSRFQGGDVVTWQRAGFRIVGILDEEAVTDEALFRELGLRRLATTHKGRAIGEVSTA